MLCKFLSRFFVMVKDNFLPTYLERQARNQRGASRGGISCPFLKIGEKCPNLEKKYPDCGHLQVKFVIQNEVFKSFHAKKAGDFYPARLFFLVLQVNVYRNALIPRKLLCPKKILVTRLKGNINSLLRSSSKLSVSS